jgi:tetratricopeptide (TPR) repeat protein
MFNKRFKESAMDSQTSSSSTTSFSATMLYSVCLIVGLLIGYLVHGNTGGTEKPSRVPGKGREQVAASMLHGMASQMPTLEQMKGMADKKAEPLLQQLKADPNNAKLLFQVGKVYESAHQFEQAVAYFDQALAQDAKDINVLAEKASCLYYLGDADGAIAAFTKALQYSPNDARALFNLGMIRWQSKGDAKGAVELWQHLLKTNPKLPSQNKAQVETLVKKASSPAHQQPAAAQ